MRTINHKRILAGLLSLFLLFGLLPGTALAATELDTYIAINEFGSTVKTYGTGKEESVLDLKAGNTYHVAAQWTFHASAEAETADSIVLAIEKHDTRAAGELGCIAVNVKTGFASEAYEGLYYTALEDLEVVVVPLSMKLFTSANPTGDFRDDLGLTMEEAFDVFVAELTDGQYCRLEFDIQTNVPKASAPADSQDPVNSAETLPDEGSEAGDQNQPSEDPRLPGTFSGVVMTNFRTSYKSDSRPDAHVMNAIVDDPNWGNELYFLHLTDLSTGEEFRQGTVQLKAGCQYQIEIVVHNASSNTKIGSYAERVTAAIEMPSELPGGSLGTLGATISASNTVPVSVSSALGLYCAESVRLEYMIDSATYQSTIGGNGSQLDYEQLFTDGASLGSVYGSKDGGHITLIIRAAADETIPVATGEDRLENPVFATAYTQLTRDPEAIDDANQESNGAAPTDDGENTDGAETGEDKEDGNGGFGVVAVLILIAIGVCVAGGINAAQQPAKPNSSGETPEEQPGEDKGAALPPAGKEDQPEGGEK